MSEQSEPALSAAPPRDGSRFRATIGIICLVGGLLGFFGLYVVPIPEGNREPLLLALGLVLGWGSMIVGYEFGSSPAGRQAAQAGLRSPLPERSE